MRADVKTTLALLQRLLAVSLLEQTGDEDLDYAVSPLAREWLLANGVPAPEQALLDRATDFQQWLWDKDVKTDWLQRLAVPAARVEAARRFVLDWIVGPLRARGRSLDICPRKKSRPASFPSFFTI